MRYLILAAVLCFILASCSESEKDMAEEKAHEMKAKDDQIRKDLKYKKPKSSDDILKEIEVK